MKNTDDLERLIHSAKPDIKANKSFTDDVMAALENSSIKRKIHARSLVNLLKRVAPAAAVITLLFGVAFALPGSTPDQELVADNVVSQENQKTEEEVAPEIAAVLEEPIESQQEAEQVVAELTASLELDFAELENESEFADSILSETAIYN